MLTRKTIQLKAALLLLSSIFSNSCSNGVYEYYDGFAKYMKDIHDTSIERDKNTIYYLLPLSDCSSCMGTELNLDMLLSLPESSTSKMKLVIIGNTKRKDFQTTINSLKTRYKDILLDKSKEVFAYQTNIGKPLIIHIFSGKCIYYNEIYDTEIETIRTYLIKQ